MEKTADMQALLAYLEGFITPERKKLFEQIIKLRTNHFTVVLEDLFQMHNSSAVVRSCDVFGVQTAHFIEQRNSNKIDRNIAMGAQKWVTTQRHTAITQCLQELREQGYQIVATTPHLHACSLNQYDISKKSAFLFGTERKGLSEQAMSSADAFLTIPMVGFTESLNISVSVAIILHELTQRLRASNIAWQLSEQERLSTLLEWTKSSIRSLDFVLQRYYEQQQKNEK